MGEIGRLPMMRRLIVIQQASPPLLVLTPLLFGSIGVAVGYAFNSPQPWALAWPLIFALAWAIVLYRMARRCRLAVFDVEAGTVSLAPMFTRLISTRSYDLDGGEAVLRIGSGPRGRVRLALAGAPAADWANGGDLVRLGWFNQDQIPAELRALGRQGETAFSA